MRQVDSEEIDGDQGRWDYDAATGQARIRIDMSLPLAVKRYILYHELQHVLVDAIDIGLEYHSNHVRTAHMGEQNRRKRNK